MLHLKKKTQVLALSVIRIWKISQRKVSILLIKLLDNNREDAKCEMRRFS